MNALTLRGLRHRIRPVADGVEAGPDLALGARRPRPSWPGRSPSSIPTLAILLIAGIPFLRLEQGVPGAEIYPEGVESRDAYVALQTEFAPGRDDADRHPRRRPGLAHGPRDDHRPHRLRRDGRRDRRDRSRRGAVHRSPIPPTGAVLPPRPRSPRSTRCRPASGRPGSTRSSPGTSAARPSGSTRSARSSPSQPAATDLIPVIRATAAGRRHHDRRSAARPRPATTSSCRRASARPYAVGLTLFASGFILFLLFGSVILPLKAVIMTLLSITASFGALVWIFQEGNLVGRRSTSTPLGYTIAGNPIIMFSVIFGLSMDYEVLLLSRIQEAYRRTGDNTASVAEGLRRPPASSPAPR